jgi:hypothetical protein
MEPGEMAAEQRRRNRLARDVWDLYEPHRRRVTQLVTSAAPDRNDARLCVLGAGNANDLDLAGLAGAFREIHLVDVDAQALEFAVNRLPSDVAALVRLHGDVDVAGLTRQESNAGDPAAVMEALSDPPRLPLPGPFDVVASTGLLTQLIEAATIRWPAGNPRFLEAVAAVRRAHLRLLLDLLSPGGTVVLVVEIVSSDTFPALRELPGDALPRTIAALINQRNFFTGANPAVLVSLLESSEFAGDVARVDVTPPWIWEFVERAYAVYALVIARR